VTIKCPCCGKETSFNKDDCTVCRVLHCPRCVATIINPNYGTRGDR